MYHLAQINATLPSLLQKLCTKNGGNKSKYLDPGYCKPNIFYLICLLIFMMYMAL